jgi:ribonuclease HI
MKTRIGAGLLFISPLGKHMRYAVRLHFPVSNNMAEHEALLCGLRIAIKTGFKHLDVRGDSQLVIDRVMNNVSCHDKKMEAYCNAVRALEDNFTASSSITSVASTMRRQTNSRRSRRGESPFP